MTVPVAEASGKRNHDSSIFTRPFSTGSVKTSNAQDEEMFSGLPPKAAIQRTSVDVSKVPISDIYAV
jgi:hypothetical protein